MDFLCRLFSTLLTLVHLGIFAHLREISVSDGSEPRNSVGSLLYNGTGLKGLSSSLLSMSYVFQTSSFAFCAFMLISDFIISVGI